MKENNNLINLLTGIYTDVLKEIDKLFESKKDIDTITKAIFTKYYYNLAKKTIQTYIELWDDIIKNDSNTKNNWKVIRKDWRVILTPYCEIKYKRRYYKNKKSGEYCYLIDKYLGIDKYQRISPMLEKNIINLSQNLSARKVAYEIAKNNPELILTRQTIKNKIKKNS